MFDPWGQAHATGSGQWQMRWLWREVIKRKDLIEQVIYASPVMNGAHLPFRDSAGAGQLDVNYGRGT
jgi:hypothetical protein